MVPEPKGSVFSEVSFEGSNWERSGSNRCARGIETIAGSCIRGARSVVEGLLAIGFLLGRFEVFPVAGSPLATAETEHDELVAPADDVPRGP